jgi:hypothetical protein
MVLNPENPTCHNLRKKTKTHRWRSSYTERRVGIPLADITPPQFCVCSKPGHVYPTLYGVLFFVVQQSIPRLSDNQYLRPLSVNYGVLYNCTELYFKSQLSGKNKSDEC